jgi:outer membrane protein assembly factor BamB
MATPISPSTSAVFVGSLSAETPELLFELNFGASGTYALFTTGEGMDSYGKYLDSDGVTILLKNDDGDVDYNFMISPIVYDIASGVKYLRVTPYNSSYYGVTFSLFFMLMSVPSVTASTPSYISHFAAKLIGEVTSSGGDTVSEYGFYWGITNNPSTQVILSAEGPFESIVVGLSPDTTYYFKAYAINSVGTGYSEVRSFITLSAVPYSENWPRFKRDNKNTGLSPLVGPINNTVKWSKGVYYSMYNRNFGLVVDSDEIAYFINSKDIGQYSVYIHSILLEDGATLWTLEIPGSGPYDFVDEDNSLTISPDGTTLYLGYGLGRLYAINRSDGAIIWMVTVASGGHHMGIPTVAPDGTIYISSYDGYVFAFDPTDGTELWSFFIGSIAEGWCGYPYIQKPIALDSNGRLYVVGGYVVAGGNASHLICLNSAGSVEWLYTPEGNSSPVGGPSIGADGIIYFFSTETLIDTKHCLRAINSGGTLEWEYIIGTISNAYPYGCPSIGNTGIIYFATHSGYLFAVNPDGTLAWQVACIGAEPCSPIVDSNENIYISSTNVGGGSFESKTFAFTAEGVKLWESSAAQVTTHTPAISSNGVLVICSEYYIYAFESISAMTYVNCISANMIQSANTRKIIRPIFNNISTP